MRYLPVRAVLSAILAAVAQGAYGAETLVTQKNMQFQQDGVKLVSIAIKPGDAVQFRNDDRVAHNVFSRTAGYEFDLGTMRTGGIGMRTFEKSGEIVVECALHPQMKFKLEVAP